ncbi:MAG: hypothetical protein ISP45_05175 [Reyranella sp.]|nr:hypothetical protein [Reyranella sp.]
MTDSAMKALAPAIALFAVVACAPLPATTPPEAQRIHSIAANDAPAIDACWRDVLKSPPHQALRARMGDHADSPTDAMKSSRLKATPEEAAQLARLQKDYLTPCRRMALASAAKVDPRIVAILNDSYAKADANTARLVAREISWGEFVSENQAIVTQRRSELLATGEGMQREQQPPPQQR